MRRISSVPSTGAEVITSAIDAFIKNCGMDATKLIVASCKAVPNIRNFMDTYSFFYLLC